MWQRARGERRSGWLVNALCVVGTFHFVCLAWIFFRAPTLGHSVLMIGRILRHTSGHANLAPKVLGVIGVGFALHWLPGGLVDRLRERFVRTPAVVQGVVLAAAAYGIHLVASTKALPFVYGQF
jgi:hypothetical protein